MKALVLTLTLALFNSAHAAPCCKNEEKSADAATESIYQLESTWTNQEGKKVTLADLKGHPVLITMGYASCKFACPRLASDLTSIEKLLTADELKQLQVVFVSIDPARDTPASLTTFLETYKVDQQRWHGLTGDNDSVIELSVALGIRYRKVNETDFAHSNIIALLSPTGEIVHRQEGLGADPKEILAALRKLLKTPIKQP